jgi:hypothetical protein
MKTAVRTLVLLSLLFMSSLAVSAQKNLLLQDVRPLMAAASDARYNVELSAEYSPEAYRLYTEERIQVEDWMLSPFRTEQARLDELIKVEREEPIQLQKWMICCTDWFNPSR